MNEKCTRCGITCWHYNDRCMVCGCLLGNIIESPGSFFVYTEDDRIRFGTTFNPDTPLPNVNIIYHAIFNTHLVVKIISKEYKSMLAQGKHKECNTYALLQSNEGNA